MNKQLTGIGICVLALLASDKACAAELKVTFNTDKPPFAYTDKMGNAVGIEIDIMREVLARSGHGMRALQVSKARLLSAVKSGEADVAASVQGKDDAGLFFSKDFVDYVNYAISRKEKHIELHDIADLDRHHFVIWQRGWGDLGASFEAKYKPDNAGHFRANYFQGGTQETQTRVFWAKRVDIIVIDKTIFAWYSRQLAATGIKVDDELVFHDIFKSRTGFAAAFKSQTLRDEFNLMLAAVRADGTYQKILNNYK